MVIQFHRILLKLNTTITGCALSRLHSLRSSPSARAEGPLRGFNRMRFARHLGQQCLGKAGKIRDFSLRSTILSRENAG